MTIAWLVVLVIIATIMTYGVIQMWLAYSHHRNIMDIPNERSAHKHPTPTSGGIGIAIAFLTCFAVILLLLRPDSGMLFGAYVALASALAVIGFIDDQADLSVRLRFGMQLVAAIVLVLLAEPLSRFYVPYIGEFGLPQSVVLPLLIIWLVGFTNMFNFMDGIDGISGVQTLGAAIGWWIVAQLVDDTVLFQMSLLLVACAVGFLLLNWHPAKIFMGDVGSLFLGFTLAAFPILAYNQTGNPRSIVVGTLFVLPFLFDATLTIIRRLLLGQNIFKPHRMHLYQRLVDHGLRHDVVTSLYGVLTVVHVASGVIYFMSNADWLLFGVLVVSSAVQVALIIYVSRVEGRVVHT